MLLLSVGALEHGMIKQIAVPLTKDEVMMIKSKGSVASPQRTPAYTARATALRRMVPPTALL